ncbi:unnamed protein product [Pieris brassicae]|uniref:Uncharacterized protein n=1 Tax=Pieris brassicae TaxID=7116 RepID=A0A9P0TBM2_PIEBR|nr:unnamed protein product [Pieris brassicae]
MIAPQAAVPFDLSTPSGCRAFLGRLSAPHVGSCSLAQTAFRPDSRAGRDLTAPSAYAPHASCASGFTGATLLG